jgi:hypothetical protein
MGAPPAFRPATISLVSIEKQLKELKRLKDKGVITEDEYEGRRRAVISRGELRPRAGPGAVAGGIFKWGAIGCLSIVGGFVLLVALIVVAIALAVRGGGSGSVTFQDGHATYAVGSSATATTAGPAKVQITIDAITDPAISPSQFQQPAAGHHFLTIAVTVQNVGERETGGGQAKLRMTDGTEYSPVFVSALGASDLNFFTKLTSGGKTTGVVAFAVEEGKQVQWLRFDPNPFADGDVYFDAQ